MRNFIQIIEAATQSGPTLLPGLPAQNYQIGSLSDVANWKAKIILANSAGEDQNVGQWDGVGYVMVSMTTDHIVPIARADEHNTGYDLLHYFQSKKSKLSLKIEIDDFVPVYFGDNFVYDKEGIERFAIVAKKWLAWGGPDTIVRGAYGADGLYGYMSDLIKHGLKMLSQPDRLNPMGEQFLKSLKGLADLMGKYTLRIRAGQDTSALERNVFRAAHTMSKLAGPIMEHMWINKPDPKTLEAKIAELEAKGDVETLGEYIFGFHGVKNAIHQKIKASLLTDPRQRDMRARETGAIFGDLNLANGMLGDL